MFKNILTLFLLLTIFPSIAMAQNGSIEGHIIDKKTGQPVIGANIFLVKESGFREGTSSDKSGHFIFENLKEGRYSIKVTAIEYQSLQKAVTVLTEKNQMLSIQLTPRTYQLNEIVVSGQNKRDIKSTTIQHVKDIEIEQLDVATVADVARLLPAAYVATNSRGQTILYLRNSADRQTAQFFNGALLNIPWDNRVDLGFIPSAMLSGVTVSKGVPSVVYGANTIGGAVNFQTGTAPTNGSVTEFKTSGGYPAKGRTSILRSARVGSFSYTAQIGFAKRGDFALPAGSDLPFSQPSNETRVNTDRQLFNLFFEGGYRFDNGARLNTTLFHVDAAKGVAPESNLNPAQTGVRYWRYPSIEQTMFIVNGMMPISDRSNLRGSAWVSRFTQDIFQYKTVAYKQLDQTQTDLDYTGGLRLIFEQQLGRGGLDLSLNLLTSRHRQSITPYSGKTPQADSSSVYHQHIYSFGAEYTLPITSNFIGSLGINYDGSAIVNTGPWENQGFESYIKSALGISAGATYLISDRFSLHATAGRRGRFPTMRELYGGALGKFVPNPTLKPVTAYKGEVGAEWLGSTFSGSITAFYNRMLDTIDKTTLQQGPNAGKEQRINLDGSRVWGVEFVTTTSIANRIVVDGSLTYMNIRGYFNDEPRKLDEKPSWVGTVALTYDLPLNFEALLQGEYIGGIYTRTEQNTFVLLPDAFILDIRLAYNLRSSKLFSGGSIFLRANNVMDDLRLLQLGLPGPGRSFLAGFRLQF
ncbi:MAG TPA: TonB-dependent receptor [Balneolaceae bacterium]